jgi:diguanylate cyclase
MTDSAISLTELMGSIALMALLAVAYGGAVRRIPQESRLQIVLGLAFGGAAVAAMLDRIPVTEGVFVDLRHLPVALAGAFLGGQGTAVAIALTIAMRIGIGGAGVYSGVVTILIAGSTGLLWHRWTRHSARRSLRSMLDLALLTSTYPVGTILLPAPAIHDALMLLLIVIAPLHIGGMVVVGTLIERERILHARERLLLRDADHDPLTGLLNRRGFERAVARLPEGGTGTLLLLDLDHFKRVNDTYGHPAGDAVLRATGERISSRLGRNDLVARLGGEELAVFLPDQCSEGGWAIARDLCEAVRSEDFVLPDGGAVRVTASVGVTWGSPDALGVLMSRADVALYAAKHAGRNRSLFAAARPAVADGSAPAARRDDARLSPWPVCCVDQGAASEVLLSHAAKAVA